MSNEGRVDNRLRTVGRSQLSEQAGIFLGLPPNEIRKILDQIFDEIANAVTRGEEVKITDFGRFKLIEKKERIARNPKTKEPAFVSARKVVSFKASRSTLELTISSHREKIMPES